LALIDTGATSTCIDEAIAKQLNLPVIDVVSIASASHADTKQNVYPAMIEVVGIGVIHNRLTHSPSPSLANRGKFGDTRHIRNAHTLAGGRTWQRTVFPSSV
jgi:hypothetical protein